MSTASTGFGLSPFGLSPFGFGTPATASEPPKGPAGCRYLNPLTRDFEQDSSTKQLAQMPPVRQRVLLALMTLVESAAADPKFGFLNPPKVTPSYRAEVEAQIRASLRQMTDVERVLRIDAIRVERLRPGRMQVTVSYTDITTGESGIASI